MLSLRNLEDIDFARVFQCLPSVAEPDSHHLSVIVQLSCNFCNLLARWQCILLKVRVENFYGLWCETGAAFAFFGGFTTHKLHQILLALLVPVFCFRQPLLQDRLELLCTLGGYIQLFKPALQRQCKMRYHTKKMSVILLHKIAILYCDIIFMQMSHTFSEV